MFLPRTVHGRAESRERPKAINKERKKVQTPTVTGVVLFFLITSWENIRNDDSI